MAGLEPARPCGRGILSPLRLPFRHIPDVFLTFPCNHLHRFASCRLAAITVADNERGRNERKPFRAQKRPWQSQRSTLRTGLRWTQVARSRVRALWKRGEVFYVRFSATDHARRARDTFRSLEGVTTVPAAKAALQNLKTEASKRSIPPMDAGLRSQNSGPGICRRAPRTSSAHLPQETSPHRMVDGAPRSPAAPSNPSHPRQRGNRLRLRCPITSPEDPKAASSANNAKYSLSPPLIRVSRSLGKILLNFQLWLLLDSRPQPAPCNHRVLSCWLLFRKTKNTHDNATNP